MPRPFTADRGRLPKPAAVAPLALGLVALAFAILPVDRAVLAAFVAATLVVLAAIDIDRGIIPNRIVLPATGVVLVMQLALFPEQALECALAGAIAAAVLMVPTLFGRAWMGMGDVKLALLLGATLGWGVVGAVLLAFVLVLPFSLFLMIRKGLAARSAMIPFGPFMALGALIILFGPTLAGLPTN